MDFIGGLLSQLVTFIFNIVATMMNAFMTPFINMILSLFPDLSARYNDFLTFFNYAFTYLTCILRWFLISPTMMIVVFDYFAVKFSIFVVSNVVRCALNIYNKLKP